ncbi:polysaccharide deacetylase family protein [Methylonatrum kenyense]|uniref:polysaccharide deacetylase family protein n=1 Tax=Methylonatrum kenyense TaxID=455253 RepID=UPI0020BDF56E|nr:polysaccharide deacetylase family protein [Methylonatrum kenyense]MCK8516804.1 polysaccharide deacetylase family protein [Methylonatrum kenyense]
MHERGQGDAGGGMNRFRAAWEKNWPEVHCAMRGGLPQFLLAARAQLSPGTVPAFCYHSPDQAVLEQDLQYLHDNGYRGLTADELLGHMRGSAPAPDRAVVLTFDDGASHLHQTVFPLLKRYGFKVVAFVAPYFHDHVRPGAKGARTCTWSELRELHQSGLVDIQSHTYEHRYLPRWPEPAPLYGISEPPYIANAESGTSLLQDLKCAKQRIEQELQGKRVRHLCFPRFNGDERSMDAARRLGYEGLWWGTLPGIPENKANGDPQRIVRVSGEFVRRLPGRGRLPLRRILGARYKANLERWLGGNDKRAGLA